MKNEDPDRERPHPKSRRRRARVAGPDSRSWNWPAPTINVVVEIGPHEHPLVIDPVAITIPVIEDGESGGTICIRGGSDALVVHQLLGQTLGYLIRNHGAILRTLEAALAAHHRATRLVVYDDDSPTGVDDPVGAREPRRRPH